MQSYDCVIVGGGPAGLSAAIYVARYNRTVAVVDHGSGRWSTHETNENYLGFPEGIRSTELRELGRRQARRFGATLVDDCKIERVMTHNNVFRAEAGEGAAFEGRTVIFATGVRDYLPDFENADVADYFGKSLFWCITCDGWKVRDKRVAIVGRDDEAATTCLQFLNYTGKLSIITNRPPGHAAFGAKKLHDLRDAGIPIYEEEIARLYGDDGFMREVELRDDRRIALDAMFSMQGARPNSLLARGLGVDVDRVGYIKVDQEQRTNVPLVYAAGDVTREYAHQIAAAVHEGATAGCTANYDLYRPEQKSA